ncbi:uncharacterized protein LOC113107181 isoform X2 [Carassius auratus]|uniref:Uncharacterized protein LOC113107181 isoform X2 n=1 Tax=Carassius auratus TaxID=7957 RepID=A0A6P6PZ34_CARAU|nr:uncharacterized protein LOC113107181 isoform X2 [Carassius auratus]XP_052418386.1 uncharacterized protein LOC127962833 isoform X1 [Carassius gibelio]
MKTNREKVIGSQVISAELVAGLLLSMAYRMCSSLAFSLKGESVSDASAQFEVTRSLVCVWVASNIKFIFFKSNKHPLSLSAHCVSRLVAFLSLLGVCREAHIQGTDSRHLPMVDVAVFLFFLLSSLILLILDHNQLKGSLKRSELLLTKPQRFFFQMDFFANCIFGLMWLVFPGWLLGSQMNGSEDNLYLTRAFGAMMVGDSFASFTTQKQMGTNEGTSAVVIFMIHTQLTTSAWKIPHLCLGLVGVSLWAGNSILGYLSSKDTTTESVNDLYWRAVQRKDRRLHVQ